MLIAKLKKRLSVPSVLLKENMRTPLILNIECKNQDEWTAIQYWAFSLGFHWTMYAHNRDCQVIDDTKVKPDYHGLISIDALNHRLRRTSIDNVRVFSLPTQEYSVLNTPFERKTFWYVDPYDDYDEEYRIKNCTVQEMQFEDYFDIIEK